MFSFASASHDLAVLALQGREAVSQLFEFEVELATDIDRPVQAHEIVGKDAKLTIAADSETPRHIHGIVRAFCTAEASARHNSYRAVLVPHLWKLSVGKRSRIFQGLSTKQIIEKVLSEWRIERRWIGG